MAILCPSLAITGAGLMSIGVGLAVLAGCFVLVAWFMVCSANVFDGLEKYVTTDVKRGSLKKIQDACQVNDMSMRNALSCYKDGKALVLCHEPLPFGIKRRCWRIPLAELKPRGDAVYDFSVHTPKGPLLFYLGQEFRKEFRLFV